MKLILNIIKKINVIYVALFMAGIITWSMVGWFFDNYTLRTPVVLQNPIQPRFKEVEVEPVVTPLTPEVDNTEDFEEDEVSTPSAGIIKTVEAAERTMSEQEIMNYIKSKDWDNSIAVRVAKSENFWNKTKSFNCSRVGGPNKNGTHDYGIFQINTVHTKTLNKMGMTMNDMKDCKKNIDFAYEYLYKNRGWQPWSSYTNGSYLNHEA